MRQPLQACADAIASSFELILQIFIQAASPGPLIYSRWAKFFVAKASNVILLLQGKPQRVSLITAIFEEQLKLGLSEDVNCGICAPARIGLIIRPLVQHAPGIIDTPGHVLKTLGAGACSQQSLLASAESLLACVKPLDSVRSPVSRPRGC